MFFKLLAASRIVILERIRTCISNFLYAVAQCCSITVNVNDRTIRPFKTLRDAIEIIEHDEQFTELHHLLLSSRVTYYACNKCRFSSNLLLSTSEDICIYEQDSDSSEIYGTPLLTSSDEILQCSNCNEKSKNLILPVFKQIHLKCPPILMCRLSNATLNTLTNFHVKLPDYLQNRYMYTSISAILIDGYNALSVVKLKDNSTFTSTPYAKPASISKSETNDIFHTARIVIVFLKQELCVNNDDRSSPPRPVSPLHQPTTVRPDKFVLNQPVTIQLIDKNTQMRFYCHVQNKQLGRSRTTTQEQDQRIVSLADQQTLATAQDIANQLKRERVNVSERTVRRRLNEAVAKYNKPISKPLLTEQHQERRLEWALTHQDMDWNEVIFSDETTICLNSVKGLVWNLPGKKKVVRTVKYPIKVNVWGCFSSKGFGRILCFRQNLDARFMCTIYKHGLLPAAYKQFGRDSTSWKLQEDNDPKHM
ncbi:unnamed protein product [Adineta ricciae]|uniref:Transposase Tc1-like domain-containing protein n=1 Tax=Adineta ricciae TaxID=249248 RepID=A0A815UDS4_ADIRI|nr:unnamed protein product [Adineta ricciae]CAF1640486.1 unnamed protein product [Adineta ricciae]